MAYIEWEDKYSVGVSLFDEDHKKLIGYINRLNINILMNETENVIKEVLSNLADYAMEHFKKEENAMVKYSYPHYFIHKRQHDDFVKKVLQLKKDYLAGNQTIGIEVMAFLKDWLLAHILGTDMSYNKFFAGKEV